MQLRLFHPLSYDGLPVKGEAIQMEVRQGYGSPSYNWRCMLCGQRGMATIYQRQDLLQWALNNHVCKGVEENYSVH